VIDHYDKLGLVKTIDASVDVDQVCARVVSHVFVTNYYINQTGFILNDYVCCYRVILSCTGI
jgi:hypothetical protein